MVATVEAVKERPILFSAPMVRAILDGRKTQTRRIIKAKVNARGHELIPPCPYGKEGDQLWVRENFWCDTREPNECVIYSEDQTKYKYRTDGIRGTKDRRDSKYSPDLTEADISKNKFWKQKPSIFMPRWASRITLEIMRVRAQHLHDIGEADAAAEGVERNEHMDGSWSAEDGYLPYCSHYPDGCECFPAFTARDSFKGLWFKINGQKSWDANPWVWVVEFKRIQA